MESHSPNPPWILSGKACFSLPKDHFHIFFSGIHKQTFTELQMVEVGRDLQSLSSPPPLLKKDHLEPVAQSGLQIAFKYPQVGRLHSLSGV